MRVRMVSNSVLYGLVHNSLDEILFVHLWLHIRHPYLVPRPALLTPVTASGKVDGTVAASASPPCAGRGRAAARAPACAPDELAPAPSAAEEAVVSAEAAVAEKEVAMTAAKEEAAAEVGIGSVRGGQVSTFEKRKQRSA